MAVGQRLVTADELFRLPDDGTRRELICNERIPAAGLPQGYFPGAPDLAIEVISPGDAAAELEEKVQHWLAAGARAVWLVFPRGPRLTVRLPDGTSRTHGPDDVVEGGDTMPGFRARLADLLRRPRRPTS